MDRIRIVLVDDHDVVRAGLRAVIASTTTMEMVGEASTRAEALQVVKHTAPDVVLLDIDLGAENGLDMLPDLRAVAPRAQVLVLTGVRDQQFHQKAVLGGARGLVLKTRAVTTLIRAIEKVHEGDVWFNRSLMADALRERARGETTPDDAAARVASLSAREREVVALVLGGMRNRQIAQALSISEATVRHHMTSIFSKLGVADRTELVIFAYRRPDLNGH